jgi:hypothetical protein
MIVIYIYIYIYCGPRTLPIALPRRGRRMRPKIGRWLPIPSGLRCSLHAHSSSSEKARLLASLAPKAARSEKTRPSGILSQNDLGDCPVAAASSHAKHDFETTRLWSTESALASANINFSKVTRLESHRSCGSPRPFFPRATAVTSRLILIHEIVY